MEIKINQIVLGPLLGVESDTKYSVCVLVHKTVNKPCLHISTLLKPIYSEYDIKLRDKYIFYRFSFDLDSDFSGSFQYELRHNNKPLIAKNGYSYWKVNVCPKDAVPKLAFVSCNGEHNIEECAQLEDKYKGWNQLIKSRPNYLFLIGDQVYSDSIYSDLKKGEINFIKRLKNHYSDTTLNDEIDAFFLNLYIKSWNKPYLEIALATIPNVMIWDDHDIIDGYGSFDCSIQNTLIPLFEVARKYYLLFQLRTLQNTALISSNGNTDLNQWLILRKYLLVLPDTRTHRTKKNVLIQSQYDLFKSKFKTAIPKDDLSLLFVLPVPIAHLDFYTFVEYILRFHDKLKGSQFDKFRAHDAIDHWDHRYHKREQKQMMDLMFDSAEKIKAKKMIIVSGDVHSAGASTIYKISTLKRFGTQLITSPIVNKPSPKLLRFFAKRIKHIGKYTCVLKNYGKSSKKLFTRRNFLIINESKGLKANLFLENKQFWDSESRQINNFQNSTSVLRCKARLSRKLYDFFN